MVELVHSGRLPNDLVRQFGPSVWTIWKWLVQVVRDTGERGDGPSRAEVEGLHPLLGGDRSLGETPATRQLRRLPPTSDCTAPYGGRLPA